MDRDRLSRSFVPTNLFYNYFLQFSVKHFLFFILLLEFKRLFRFCKNFGRIIENKNTIFIKYIILISDRDMLFLLYGVILITIQCYRAVSHLCGRKTVNLAKDVPQDNCRRSGLLLTVNCAVRYISRKCMQEKRYMEDFFQLIVWVKFISKYMYICFH